MPLPDFLHNRSSDYFDIDWVNEGEDDREKASFPLLAYARAMQCPVLASRTVLRNCYAMSGADLAYRRYLPTRVLLHVRY
eukprot:3941591-Rhodomonas_salina.4